MSRNLLNRVVSSIADRTSESVPRRLGVGPAVRSGETTGVRSDERRGRRVDRRGGVGTDGDVPHDRADGDSPAVGLYACRDCSTTYVSEGMDDCGACGGTVERVPNGKDLGHV